MLFKMAANSAQVINSAPGLSIYMSRPKTTDIFTSCCIQMKFLITFLLMSRLKENNLCPGDKSMRKLFERNKRTCCRLKFFYNAFRVITPAYIPTIGLITTVYSKTAP